VARLVQFWLSQDHKPAIDAIAACTFVQSDSFKRILITATGFRYGASRLFAKGFLFRGVEDDLDVTVAINYVDRFPEQRLHFMSERTELANRLQSDPTNQKLALLVGFLYEQDASRELEPRVHATVKAACKEFKAMHAECLDEDSLNALEKLLKSL
jgi:hypothetical protein